MFWSLPLEHLVEGLGVVDVGEGDAGDGDIQELAEWLPPLLHVEHLGIENDFLLENKRMISFSTILIYY